MTGDGDSADGGDMREGGGMAADGEPGAPRGGDDGDGTGGPMVHVQRGEPTDEEVAAIVAAVEAVWPRPVATGGGPERAEPYRWRFSGRWWAKPVPVRRDRPADYL